MNLDVMLADQKIGTEIEAIKKMILALRKYNVSDEKILANLKENYGNHFSEEQLKHYINSAK